jgi:hypothetical protein
LRIHCFTIKFIKMARNHISISIFRNNVFQSIKTVEVGESNLEVIVFKMLNEHNINDDNYEVRVSVIGEKCNGVIISGVDIESDLLDNVITDNVNKLIKYDIK